MGYQLVAVVLGQDCLGEAQALQLLLFPQAHPLFTLATTLVIILVVAVEMRADLLALV
jgi:hypothetical protein